MPRRRPGFATARPQVRLTDLVRLVLERCRSARQGVDLLTDMVTRHGQGTPGDPPWDNAFLVIDP